MNLASDWSEFTVISAVGIVWLLQRHRISRRGSTSRACSKLFQQFSDTTEYLPCTISDELIEQLTESIKFMFETTPEAVELGPILADKYYADAACSFVSMDDSDIQFTSFASSALEKDRRRFDEDVVSFKGTSTERAKNSLLDRLYGWLFSTTCSERTVPKEPSTRNMTSTLPAMARRRRLYVDLWKAIVREKEEPTNVVAASSKRSQTPPLAHSVTRSSQLLGMALARGGCRRRLPEENEPRTDICQPPGIAAARQKADTEFLAVFALPKTNDSITDATFEWPAVRH